MGFEPTTTGYHACTPNRQSITSFLRKPNEVVAETHVGMVDGVPAGSWVTSKDKAGMPQVRAAATTRMGAKSGAGAVRVVDGATDNG